MTATANATVQAADAILVAAARSGDLFAWEHLVRRYQEPSTAWPSSSCGTRPSPRRPPSPTFLRAYRALPSLEEDRGLQPWLFRIAAGEARQQRRDSGRPRHSSRPVERISGPRLPRQRGPRPRRRRGSEPRRAREGAQAFDRLGEDDRLDHRHAAISSACRWLMRPAALTVSARVRGARSCATATAAAAQPHGGRLMA